MNSSWNSDAPAYDSDVIGTGGNRTRVGVQAEEKGGLERSRVLKYGNSR